MTDTAHGDIGRAYLLPENLEQGDVTVMAWMWVSVWIGIKLLIRVIVIIRERVRVRAMSGLESSLYFE